MDDMKRCDDCCELRDVAELEYVDEQWLCPDCIDDGEYEDWDDGYDRDL